jgi:DNA invertase Pin-like site-specific DNA recombinase
MKKVYGYIRVSTVKQGEGVSLIAQKEAIARYATQYNLEIVQWFEEKETAAKQGRPLFTTMMKLLQTKKADGVIIHKIDRGARNLKDWSDLDSLIDQGVEVHFAHESLDLQARGGRLSADIQAVIAADYIRNLRQEAIKGIYGRLKQGIYPFQAPTGYLNNGGGKYKTSDTIQAPLVKMAFELYATKQYTLRTLAAHMERLGLKNIKGKGVNKKCLSIILNNQFYMGIIRVKGMSFNGGHEPIITPDLFKKVQLILRGNTNQKVNKHDFKFRKLLTCQACGYFLVAEIQKGRVYYRCHTRGCVTKSLREVTIENLLFKAFASAELNPEESATLDTLLQETEQHWVEKQQEMLSAIKLQAGQINQKIERLTDCYLEGGIDKETYENRKAKLLVECKTKEATEKTIQQEKDRIFTRVRRFLELAKDLKKSYEIGNLEEQREFMEIVTSNLQVEGRKLIISMQSPFLELSQRWFLTSGAPERAKLRKTYTKLACFGNYEPTLAYSDINTSPIIGKPLSKESLRCLLDLIIESVGKLPELEPDHQYSIAKTSIPRSESKGQFKGQNNTG